MVRRGLSVRGLAKAAGLSAPTISTALAGRAIAAYSLRQIAETLTRIPPIDIVDALLTDGPDVSTSGSLGV